MLAGPVEVTQHLVAKLYSPQDLTGVRGHPKVRVTHGTARTMIRKWLEMLDNIGKKKKQKKTHQKPIPVVYKFSVKPEEFSCGTYMTDWVPVSLE